MRLKPLHYLPLFTLCFLSTYSRAQSGADLHLTYSNALEPSSGAKFKNALGAGFRLIFSDQKVAVSPMMGVGVEYLYYDRSRQSFSYDSLAGTRGKYIMNSQSWGLHVVPGISFKIGPVQPYAGIIIGSRWFRYNQKIKVPAAGAADSTVWKNNLSTAITFNVGLSGGVRIRLNETMDLNLRTEYMKGSKAQIVDPSSVQFSPGGNEVSFKTKQVKTDMLLFSIGLSLLFNDKK